MGVRVSVESAFLSCATSTVAHEFEVEKYLTLIRQVTNRVKKHGLSDAEAFIGSPKVMRRMLEADLGV